MIIGLLQACYGKSPNLTIHRVRALKDTHKTHTRAALRLSASSIFNRFGLTFSTTLNREISDRRRLTPLSLVVRVGKWVAVKYGSQLPLVP
jgi:hypothetical protein